MIRRSWHSTTLLGKLRYYDWMQIIKKKNKQMARRLGRQIGDRRDNFSRQSFFSTRHGDQNGRSLERWYGLFFQLKRSRKMP